MKRVISLCIIATFIFAYSTVFSVHAKASVTSDKVDSFNNDVSLLYNLKITGISEEYSEAQNSYVSRGEAVAAVMRCIIQDCGNANITTGEGRESVSKAPYSDVNVGDWFAPNLDMAKGMGIIAQADTFRPLDNITVDEFIKVVVSAAGYSIVAEQKGGFPSGYVSTAYDMKLYKNTNNSNGYLTRADFATILVNLLKTSPMTDTSYGVNGTYEILAFSEAVQAKGFDNAVAALNTAFGDTANGYHPWGDGVNIPVVLSDVDDMRAAMKNPGAKIVLDDDMIIDDDKGTGYALYAKYNCEIDLNGNDIKVNMPDKEFYGIVHALKGAKVDIVGDGNIEINGGIGQFIWCTGGADSATDKPADGTTVNIYGGNWIQDYSKVDVDTNNFVEGIYANRGGIINIYGGKFQWKNAEKYTVNESRGGIINIYGGTFINFDPRVSHDNDGSYVAEGYTVVSEIQANGDVWYTVVPE